MKHAFLLAGFILLSLISANGQAGFRLGTMVTNEGDTLAGLIRPMDRFVLYRPDKNAELQKYRFQNIRSFNLNDQEWELHAAEVLKGTFPEQVTSFMKVLVDGPVRLLEYTGEDYYGVHHVNYLLTTGGKPLMRVSRSGFKKEMSLYFGANKDLSSRIESGELTYDHLPAVVAMFNNWVLEGAPGLE